ncbi:MAG: DNRLRE domain-containing protein, partial [Acidobacteriaceae bacterium]
MPLAAGAQATLVADAHVSSALPTVNSGTLTNLNVGGGYTALVRFDLSLLPAGTTPSQVTRAVLRVYCNRADTPGLVALQPVGSAWGEYSVTYATLPALGAAVQTAQVGAADTFVTFDVTATVQGWIATPASNNGLALTAGSAVVQFDSKENDQTSHAPELQIVLAAGGVGTEGPVGAAGPQGSQGVAGAQGLTGAQGVPGPQGVPGLPGAAGTNGATGATGATGPQGPPGTGNSAPSLSYQGIYSSATNYALDDVVTFAGSSYVSLTASNHANTPGLTANAWGLLASAGAAGTTGVAGPSGATGPQGPVGFGVPGPQGVAGAQGAVGAAGAPGLVYQGVYDSTANYVLGDVVLFAGASYASLVNFNHGQTPGSSPAFWGALTAQGPQGVQGFAGAAGPTGASGPPGSVGPPGQTGAQGLQGTAGQAGAQGVAGIAGAQGLSGPAGAQGAAGPVGLAFRGAYDATVNYALADGVLFQGTGYVSLAASNHGNAPDQSPQFWEAFATGTPGAAGAMGAPGVSGPPGSQGPAGFDGAVGPRGLAGPVGPPGVNFTGNYSSANSYAIADAVSFGGSTFISLVGNNHGNTPDQSPAFWAVLAAQGQAGAGGPVGPAGLPGAAGS